MLNSIIAFSVRNKLIIGLFVIALLGYGTYEVTKLPIDAVPDITNNQVQVITIAPSFGAVGVCGDFFGIGAGSQKARRDRIGCVRRRRENAGHYT